MGLPFWLHILLPHMVITTLSITMAIMATLTIISLAREVLNNPRFRREAESAPLPEAGPEAEAKPDAEADPWYYYYHHYGYPYRYHYGYYGYPYYGRYWYGK